MTFVRLTHSPLTREDPRGTTVQAEYTVTRVFVGSNGLLACSKFLSTAQPANVPNSTPAKMVLS